jgi:hypothetical protein
MPSSGSNTLGPEKLEGRILVVSVVYAGAPVVAYEFKMWWYQVNEVA